MIVLLCIIIGVCLLGAGICAGISIGEQNMDEERHRAFLEGRRAERADQMREPL